jgi:hypothetical protein
MKTDRLEQRDGKWCAVSEDGTRSFGCFDTEGEARERLRQVEAAKAAKGDSVFRVDKLGPIHTDPTRTDGVLATLTPEGFLQCSALLTRTGVFDYEDALGNTWGEFRDADEVFAQESLDSFRMVVVTDDHPAGMVNVDNVKDVQVGHVGSDVHRDGDFVRASLTITDANVIRSIQDGKVELSCGYFAQVVQDAGVAPDGTPFTSRQEDIRGNHLALVDVGRAGPSCRLQLDSGDAITREDITTMPNKKKNTSHTDEMVIVGGEEFDVPAEVAVALSEMSDKIEAQAIELAKVSAPAAEEPVAEDESDKDLVVSVDQEEPPMKDPNKEENKAMTDAMQAKIDSLEAKLEDSTNTQDARIDARVKLVTTCRKILGEDVITDGIAEIDLRKAVVIHVTPSMKAKLDGKSADYVQAAYEMALDTESTRVDSSDDLLDLAGQAIVDGTEGDDADTAHADMLKRLQNNSYNTPSRKEMN